MRANRFICQLPWALIATASPLLRQSQEHSAGRWTDLPPVGTGPVQEHGAAATSSDLYVIGGISLNASTASSPPSRYDVSAYNFKTATWRSVASLPLGLTHANAAEVDGKIYVLGGLTGDGKNALWIYTTACLVYDPKLDTWTELPPMAEDQGRGASAVGVFGTTVYLAGGLRSTHLVPGGLEETIDTVTSYDVRTGVWTTLPSLPAPRDHVAGAVVGTKFFVAGGRDHGHANFRNTTWALDLRAPEAGWAVKSEMPTARGGLASGIIGRHIVTFGGEGNAAAASGVFPQTEAYDVECDEWTKLDPMPVPRHGMTAASVRGSIFIAGGGIVEAGGEPVDIFTSFTL
ncbi:hypothetical protein F5Y19DRAFT_448934 [Xylariaceae sp. FL1651]|nr:hypothetical protein F5Y19DRAFT_448934 [Xylariaceae sp. FL1651]